MPILSHIEQFLQFTFIRNNCAQNNTMYIKFFYGGYQYHNPHNDTLTRYSLYAPFQLFFRFESTSNHNHFALNQIRF